MRKFLVKVTETVYSEVEVEADSGREALYQAGVLFGAEPSKYCVSVEERDVLLEEEEKQFDDEELGEDTGASEIFDLGLAGEPRKEESTS